jgi:hypothetical protein
VTEHSKQGRLRLVHGAGLVRHLKNLQYSKKRRIASGEALCPGG